MSNVDKKGGRAVVSSSGVGLRRVIDGNRLIDLGYRRHNFAQNNRRGRMTNIEENKALANASWKM